MQVDIVTALIAAATAGAVAVAGAVGIVWGNVINGRNARRVEELKARSDHESWLRENRYKAVAAVFEEANNVERLAWLYFNVGDADNAASLASAEADFRNAVFALAVISPEHSEYIRAAGGNMRKTFQDISHRGEHAPDLGPRYDDLRTVCERTLANQHSILRKD